MNNNGTVKFVTNIMRIIMKVKFINKNGIDNRDEVKSLKNIMWTPLATLKTHDEYFVTRNDNVNLTKNIWGSQERRNVNKLDFVTAGVLPLHIVFMEVKIEFQQRQMKWQNLITLSGRVTLRRSQAVLLFSLRAEVWVAVTKNTSVVLKPPDYDFLDICL
jgi:hypothetical protein